MATPRTDQDPEPTDAAPEITAPEIVHLIFPPLVSSSFGSYYPSTAVLAGYLAAKEGIVAGQEDLNQRFAEYLLSPQMLKRLGSGGHPDAPYASLAAATARWAAHHRAELVDQNTGHLLLKAYEAKGAIPKALAQPFFSDSDESVLTDVGASTPLLDLLRDFYAESGVADRAGAHRLVGISVPMGPQLVPTLALAKFLHDAHPGLRLVLGGPAMSLMNPSDIDAMLRHHPYVDCVVRFDGELPLTELARQVSDDRWDPATVAGVSCLTDGTTRHNAPSAGPNLNSLPFPTYSSQLMSRLAIPKLSITQARGCYWGKCDYCDFIELYDGSPPFRSRHPSNFVDELQELVERHGVRRYVFITESIPPAFARKMSELLIERQLEVEWISFAMVDRRFDRELLELMVRGGCDHLVIGLETTITRVLKLVHKSADRDENFRFLRDAKAAGMRLRVNLIPDLPTTTYDEAMQCLADMRELMDCFDDCYVFPFEPTRSSAVGRTPEKFGLTVLADPADLAQPGHSYLTQYALNHSNSIDTAMTPEQRAEVHRRYQAFEEETIARGRGASAAPAHSAISGAAEVRIPVEHLDVVVDHDRIVTHNMKTVRRVDLSDSAERVLTAHLDGLPFTRSELIEHVDPTSAPKILRELAELGLLAPVDGP